VRTLHIAFANNSPRFIEVSLVVNGEEFHRLDDATPCGANLWCKDITLLRPSGEHTEIRIAARLLGGEVLYSDTQVFEW
jgi:hypothetical protein